MSGSIIRTKTGRSSQFHDLLQVIRTIVVPSDTDTVTFSGLNGDLDGYYLLRAKIKSGSGAGDNIIFRPNGSDANMKSVYQFNSGVGITPDVVTYGKIGALGSVNSVSVIEVGFSASKADGLPRAGFWDSVRGISVSDLYYNGMIRYNDIATLITSIDIFTDQGSGSGIKAGSVLTLLKSPVG